MIVRRLDGTWILTAQDDHAHHAGTIAAAWNDGPFGPLPSKGHLVTATSLHDNGWRVRDAEPRVDPETHGPLNFMHVRDHDHSAFYRRGIENVTAEDPVAGYLVSLHASGIYGGRYGWSGLEHVAWPEISETGRRFLDEQQSYRAGLIDAIHEEDPAALEFETMWQAYMLLQAFDYLSLMQCLGPFSTGCAPVPLGGGYGRLEVRNIGPWTLALEPFPFQGDELTLTVPTRVLHDQSFAGDAELKRAIEATPPAPQTTRFVSAT